MNKLDWRGISATELGLKKIFDECSDNAFSIASKKFFTGILLNVSADDWKSGILGDYAPAKDHLKLLQYLVKLESQYFVIKDQDEGLDSKSTQMDPIPKHIKSVLFHKILIRHSTAFLVNKIKQNRPLAKAGYVAEEKKEKPETFNSHLSLVWLFEQLCSYHEASTIFSTYFKHEELADIFNLIASRHPKNLDEQKTITSILDRLLWTGIFSVHGYGTNGYTPLHVVQCSYVAEALLKWGANLQDKAKTMDQETPIVFASKKADDSVLVAFKEFGSIEANINFYHSKESPLSNAIIKRDTQLINQFLTDFPEIFDSLVELNPSIDLFLSLTHSSTIELLTPTQIAKIEARVCKDYKIFVGMSENLYGFIFISRFYDHLSTNQKIYLQKHLDPPSWNEEFTSMLLTLANFKIDPSSPIAKFFSKADYSLKRLLLETGTIGREMRYRLVLDHESIASHKNAALSLFAKAFLLGSYFYPEARWSIQKQILFKKEKKHKEASRQAKSDRYRYGMSNTPSESSSESASHNRSFPRLNIDFISSILPTSKVLKSSIWHKHTSISSSYNSSSNEGSPREKGFGKFLKNTHKSHEDLDIVMHEPKQDFEEGKGNFGKLRKSKSEKSSPRKTKVAYFDDEELQKGKITFSDDETAKTTIDFAKRTHDIAKNPKFEFSPPQPIHHEDTKIVSIRVPHQVNDSPHFVRSAAKFINSPSADSIFVPKGSVTGNIQIVKVQRSPDMEQKPAQRKRSGSLNNPNEDILLKSKAKALKSEALPQKLLNEGKISEESSPLKQKQRGALKSEAVPKKLRGKGKKIGDSSPKENIVTKSEASPKKLRTEGKKSGNSSPKINSPRHASGISNDSGETEEYNDGINNYSLFLMLLSLSREYLKSKVEPAHFSPRSSKKISVSIEEMFADIFNQERIIITPAHKESTKLLFSLTHWWEEALNAIEAILKLFEDAKGDYAKTMNVLFQYFPFLTTDYIKHHQSMHSK